MQISPINTTNSTNNFKCNVILAPNSYPPVCPRTMVDTLYKKLSVDQQNKVKNLMNTLANLAPDKEIVLPSCCHTAIIAKKVFGS